VYSYSMIIRLGTGLLLTSSCEILPCLDPSTTARLHLTSTLKTASTLINRTMIFLTPTLLLLYITLVWAVNKHRIIAHKTPIIALTFSITNIHQKTNPLDKKRENKVNLYLQSKNNFTRPKPGSRMQNKILRILNSRSGIIMAFL